MVSLVICEKPSVGRDIAAALGVKNKKNGYCENNSYIVTWAMGHLVTLAPPERYDNRFKTWDMKDLPILPDKLKYDVIGATSKQYNVIKGLINNSKVGKIIIATDAGREGELVARLILEKANNKKPVKRLWISSVTKKAILDGFNKLQPGEKYYGLYMSALARSYADWAVGLNASRALTTKYNASLNCGRVQTPTVQLIYNQEQKVSKFVAKEYFLLKVKGEDIDFRFDTDRQFDKSYIDNIKLEVANETSVVITSVEEKQVEEHAKPLYDLTQLQIEASQKYGFSPKQTLDLMQSLYEFHKVLTYPRTDSRYLTLDMKDTIKERIRACDIFGFNVNITDAIINTSKCFNDSKVSDHHAIIPTETNAKNCNFSDSEAKIYKMVVQRFLQVFMKSCITNNISVTASIGKHNFISNTSRVIAPGFKSVEGIVANHDGFLSVGSKLKVQQVFVTSEYTKSPGLLTEATLIDAMENPFKYIEVDQKSKQVLKETKGIGTVATRADIIEKLFNSFLIEKIGNGIKTTSKGKQLLEIVPSDLKSPLLTAKWEQEFLNISNKKSTFESFKNEINVYTKKLITEIKTSEKSFTHDNLTQNECPKCGAKMLKVTNKSGDEMLACSNVDCKHKIRTKSLTKVQCPECRKKLYKIYNENGDFLTCMRCGFKMKERDFFDKPKKNEASKQDLKKYLKQEEKPDVESSPFASLLGMFDED